MAATSLAVDRTDGLKKAVKESGAVYLALTLSIVWQVSYASSVVFIEKGAM